MKPQILIWVIAIALSFSNIIFGQTTFKNPILTGMNPDPSICRAGDDYYLITSTFEYFPGLPIYKSKDLVHWKMIGYVLSRAANNPLMGATSGTGGQYAPTIRYHDSTFYVCCTNYGGNGSQGQFYVTAKDPAGPWSNPIWVNNWYVDPSITFANDSMYYLTPNNSDGFLLGTMNPKNGRYYKSLQKVALGLGGSSPEGPHLYKINNYYYIMSAEGGTGYEHREVIQRSASPWGPYVKSPINPVVSHKDDPDNPFQAIGHADLVQLQDSSWWLVCLGIRPKGNNYHHLGRETFLAPVTWNADGWPKVGTDGIVKEELTAPNLPEYIWGKDSVRDNFDSTSLKLCWNFIRNPHAADWSLTENPGYLRLKGSKISFKEKDSPAFIGRRQTAFNAVASAKISFTPTATNEEAGLVVRGDDINHYDLFITMFADKRVVMFRKYLQDKVVSVNYKEIPDGDIILRVSATELQYQFWAQTEGKAAIQLGTAATKNLSTEFIGGFTGTYIGMYASGNGTANVNPADFEWFDFEEEPTLPYSWATGSKDSLNQMVAPEIISASSNAYDSAKITWNNITNESGYIIEKFVDNKFDSVGNTTANDTVFTDSGLTGKSMYIYRIKAFNDNGYSYSSVTVSVTTLPKPGPYLGTPSQIPGKIEVENYDDGIESFYDTDSVNSGGKYRSDGVDVEPCSDAGNGYDVGWIGSGEWLLYTVDILDTLIDIQLRVASPSGGSLKIELDGNEIAQASIPSTGDWQKWATVTIANVKVEKGTNKKLKMKFTSSGFNFNWANFVKAGQSKVANAKLKSLEIFPNPTTGMFQIKTNKGLAKLELITLTGQIAKTIQPANNNTFDISELNAGTYIAKVYSGSNEISFFKLVKK